MTWLPSGSAKVRSSMAMPRGPVLSVIQPGSSGAVVVVVGGTVVVVGGTVVVVGGTAVVLVEGAVLRCTPPDDPLPPPPATRPALVWDIALGLPEAQAASSNASEPHKTGTRRRRRTAGNPTTFTVAANHAEGRWGWRPPSAGTRFSGGPGETPHVAAREATHRPASYPEGRRRESGRSRGSRSAGMLMRAVSKAWASTWPVCAQRAVQTRCFTTSA